jgi:hypothetical protein
MKKRKLLQAEVEYLDPLNCGSTLGYNIVEWSPGTLYGDVDITDCNRKVTWKFSARDEDPLGKIDRAIGLLIRFRSKFDLELSKAKKRRRPRKRRA